MLITGRVAVGGNHTFDRLPLLLIAQQELKYCTVGELELGSVLAGHFIYFDGNVYIKARPMTCKTKRKKFNEGRMSYGSIQLDERIRCCCCGGGVKEHHETNDNTKVEESNETRCERLKVVTAEEWHISKVRSIILTKFQGSETHNSHNFDTSQKISKN